MRRRQILAGVAGALVAPVAVGRARGNDPFRPLGREEVPGSKEVVVDDDGSTAYLAATDGFAAVDLTDPTEPSLLSERRDLLADREDGPMEAIWDVALDGDRLVVAGPANPARTVSGFLLYDVSDPAAPEQVAFHETPYPIHNATFVDGVAYLTANGSIATVDVSDDDPREVGGWSIVDEDDEWSEVQSFLRSPHDLWVQDGLAYVACWDAGTWIVDVSDPGSPEAVGRVGGLPIEDLRDLSQAEASRESTEPPGNHHYVQPSADGSLLAVGKESWSTDAGSAGASGIDLWDVSDPTSPTKHSEIAPPRASDERRVGTWTTAHNFHLVGDRLFSSWYQGGVKIHDVSDPSDTEELAWWRRPDDAAFWAAVLATEDFFVASSTDYPAQNATEGLYVFPNREGDQPDPPSLTGTSADATRSRTVTSTSSPGSGNSPTENGTVTASTRTGTDASRTMTAAATSSGQPGFGALAGATGIGVAALRALRSRGRTR